MRGYEKWKLDAGKSPVDVNANRLEKRESRSIEMCYSIGACARLGRERVLTGTTRREHSPLEESSRAPETARYIGNTVEKCVAHPAKHEKTPRQTIREICGKIPTRSDNGEGRSKQEVERKEKVFHQEIKRDPYFSSRNVPHIREILEKEGKIFSLS